MFKYENKSKVKIIDEIYEYSRKIIKLLIGRIIENLNDQISIDDLNELKMNYNDLQKNLNFLKKNLYLIKVNDDEKIYFNNYIETLFEIRNDKAHQRSIKETSCLKHFSNLEKGIFLTNKTFPNIVKTRYLNRINIIKNVFNDG